jgi:hypothetical protein
MPPKTCDFCIFNIHHFVFFLNVPDHESVDRGC